jgi:hypothetical protein
MIKKFFHSILFSIFLLNLNLNAVIIESSEIEDVFKYADKNSIVVFDIDSTLVEIEYGLEYWVSYKAKELEKIGLANDKACDLALYTFFVISQVAKLFPINNSPKVIGELQKMKIPSIALTNRSLPVVKRTKKLLKNIDIDFSKNGLIEKDLDLQVTHNAMFSKGIIFAGKNDKGKALALFFNKINYAPKKLIYVDDRVEYVKSVEKEFDRNNIEFIGIRYSFMDGKKRDFDPVVAEKNIDKLKIQLGLEPIGAIAEKVKDVNLEEIEKVEDCGWIKYILDSISYPFRKIYALFA